MSAGEEKAQGGAPAPSTAPASPPARHSGGSDRDTASSPLDTTPLGRTRKHLDPLAAGSADSGASGDGGGSGTGAAATATADSDSGGGGGGVMSAISGLKDRITAPAIPKVRFDMPSMPSMGAFKTGLKMAAQVGLGFELTGRQRAVEYVATLAMSRGEAYLQRVVDRLTDAGLVVWHEEYKPTDDASLKGVEDYVIFISAQDDLLHATGQQLRVQRWLKSGGLGQPPEPSTDKLWPRLRLEYMYHIISEDANIGAGPPADGDELRPDDANFSDDEDDAGAARGTPAGAATGHVGDHSDARSDALGAGVKEVADNITNRVSGVMSMAKNAILDPEEEAAERKRQDELRNLVGKKSTVRLTVDRLVPLHDPMFNMEMLSQITSWKDGLLMPLDRLTSIRNHFGDEVGYKVAWTVHYSNMLIVPAIISIVLQIIMGIDFDFYSKWFAPAFTLFALIWASVLMVTWQRYNNKLKLLWDQDNADAADEVRPNFYGVWRDPFEALQAAAQDSAHYVKLRLELWYPNWKRYLKIAVVIPVCIAFLMVMITFAGLTFIMEIWITDVRGDTFFLWVATPDILFAALAALCEDLAFPWVAVKLTDWCNWKYHSQYETGIAVKTFLMWFLSVQGYFFILAFIYVPLGDTVFANFAPGWDRVRTVNKVDKVRSTLQTFFVVTQSVNLAIKVALPRLLEKANKSLLEVVDNWKAKRGAQLPEESGAATGESAPSADGSRGAASGKPGKSAAVAPDTSASGAAASAAGAVSNGTSGGDVAPYGAKSGAWAHARAAQHGVLQFMAVDPSATHANGRPKVNIAKVYAEVTQSPYSPFNDYAEEATQLSYLLMFAPALFPLGFLAAFINNVLEMRSDTFKMVLNHSRIIPRVSSGIGIWETIIEFISYGSIFVSVALLLVTLDLGTVLIAPFVNNYTAVDAVVFCFIIERLMLAANYAVAKVLPGVPQSVRLQQRYDQFRFKVRWQEMMVSKKGELKRANSKLFTQHRDAAAHSSGGAGMDTTLTSFRTVTDDAHAVHVA